MPPHPTRHVPVLLAEVLQWLRPRPGATFVDGTLGGGGHARALAEAAGRDGLVIAVDKDRRAVEAAAGRLAGLSVRAFAADYCDLPEVLAANHVTLVDGILLDLGLSSDQLADRDRGFSFDSSGPLDLRFDPTRGEPAWKLIKRLSKVHLANLIYEFGEERRSRRIAEAIVRHRALKPIRTAEDLAEVVRRAMPKKRTDRIHPATRTFQALRMAVNDELKSLHIALERLPDCLAPGGRIAIISFHSLEDRPVKQAFATDDRLVPLSRKPIRPSLDEVIRNPRARSAKMRVAQRKASDDDR